MSEFIQTFQFVLLPFLVMVAFALVLPAVGSALYIRNEMMLAIGLPPLSSAALTLGVVCGMHPESHVVLSAVAFVTSLAVVSIVGNLRLSEIKRQILLASFFAGGSAATHLLMSMSPHAHAHLGFLLTGELLSLGPSELVQSLVLCAVCVGMMLCFRNAVFSYCIDEEMMRLRTKRFRAFSMVYRLLLTLVLSAAVLFIGPLLTAALLIFPPMLSDWRKSSMAAFFVTAVVVGLAGASGGFVVSVAVDIPPAYGASAGVLAIGLVPLGAVRLLGLLGRS